MNLKRKKKESVYVLRSTFRWRSVSLANFYIPYTLREITFGMYGSKRC